MSYFFSFPDDRAKIRYSIYSGDPVGMFKIDPTSGAIRTSSVLDHETRPYVLLNVQATSGEPPVYGHTQVSELNSLFKNQNNLA